MPLSLYQASVPVYLKVLNGLSAILDKAAEHAKENKYEPGGTPECAPVSRHVVARPAGAGGGEPCPPRHRAARRIAHTDVNEAREAASTTSNGRSRRASLS